MAMRSARFQGLVLSLLILSSGFVDFSYGLSLTVSDTECVYEYVAYDGDAVSGNFVVVDHDIFWGSDHPGIDFTVCENQISDFSWFKILGSRIWKLGFLLIDSEISISVI